MLDIFAKIWELFWSIWPKNFWFLVLASGVAEAVSVVVLRQTGNKGWISIVGYIAGFLTVAFYAESQKYSTLSYSYPVWLVSVAVLVSLSAFFIFHDQFSYKWLLGFILAMVGIILIQLSTSE